MNDALMIFYSLEGNTAYAAEIIKKYCPEITLEQLKTEKEPPKSGFGKYFVGGRSAIFKEDPNLLPLKVNIDDFKKIFIGFPIWAGTFPPAIGALLKSVKISGKDVYIIACSSGGNAKKAVTNLGSMLSDNNIKGSLSLIDPIKNKDDAERKIKQFLGEQELISQ